MGRKKKVVAEKKDAVLRFDGKEIPPMPNEISHVPELPSIIQEANRLFFHIHGLNLTSECKIEKPSEPVRLEFGEDVKEEIANVKAVQEMRTVAAKKRVKAFGYAGAQPVVSKTFR